MALHAGRHALDFKQSVHDNGSGTKSGKDLLGNPHRKNGQSSFDQEAPALQAKSGRDLTGGMGGTNHPAKSTKKPMKHVNQMPSAHGGSIGTEPKGV